ncbi:hypothetical protein E2C01_063165 [Portunus trituberculatus]|uniref:Uncharacterized protein n=1 Tax=Portunus trituberculatus TaxID=210409 RepID=A0A5B7HCZ6_PORTR|nr:hypothetical protein [Portunus trituberculatus]
MNVHEHCELAAKTPHRLPETCCGHERSPHSPCRAGHERLLTSLLSRHSPPPDTLPFESKQPRRGAPSRLLLHTTTTNITTTTAATASPPKRPSGSLRQHSRIPPFARLLPLFPAAFCRPPVSFRLLLPPRTKVHRCLVNNHKLLVNIRVIISLAH